MKYVAYIAAGLTGLSYGLGVSVSHEFFNVAHVWLSSLSLAFIMSRR